MPLNVPAPATCTDSPTQNPCGEKVVPVTVLPDLASAVKVLAGYVVGLTVAWYVLAVVAGGLMVTGKVNVVAVGTAAGRPE